MKLNLKYLGLGKVCAKDKEDIHLENGKLIDFAGKIDDIYETSDVFCSYGKFYIYREGGYYGLDYMWAENGDIIPLGFNGEVLSSEEFNRKRE